MRSYWVGGLGGLVLVSVGVHVSSTACNEPASSSYGNPNTLDRKNIPGDGGSEPLVCGADGGLKFDGGDCPSFETDIYPYLTAGGKWKCADTTCHGGTSSPAIDGTSATGCLESLKKITVAGRPYLTSDGGDPNTATFVCNLQGSCGSQMPDPPAPLADNNELCMIEAWLRCGSR